MPSGNFGNLCAGLLAYKSGLPASHFIAACNENDTVPEYFKTGEYEAKTSVATLSNAMDVGDPSNFVRILELFDGKYDALSELISSYSISDEETTATLKKVVAKNNYLLDPHGAVAYASLKKYLKEHPGPKGIFLETAHPVKFHDVVEPLVETTIELPSSIQYLINHKKQATAMEADYLQFKEYLRHTFTPA